MNLNAGYDTGRPVNQVVFAGLESLEPRLLLSAAPTFFLAVGDPAEVGADGPVRDNPVIEIEAGQRTTLTLWADPGDEHILAVDLDLLSSLAGVAGVVDGSVRAYNPEFLGMSRWNASLRGGQPGDGHVLLTDVLLVGFVTSWGLNANMAALADPTWAAGAVPLLSFDIEAIDAGVTELRLAASGGGMAYGGVESALTTAHYGIGDAAVRAAGDAGRGRVSELADALVIVRAGADEPVPPAEVTPPVQPEQTPPAAEESTPAPEVSGSAAFWLSTGTQGAQRGNPLIELRQGERTTLTLWADPGSQMILGLDLDILASLAGVVRMVEGSAVLYNPEFLGKSRWNDGSTAGQAGGGTVLLRDLLAVGLITAHGLGGELVDRYDPTAQGGAVPLLSFDIEAIDAGTAELFVTPSGGGMAYAGVAGPDTWAWFGVGDDPVQAAGSVGRGQRSDVADAVIVVHAAPDQPSAGQPVADESAKQLVVDAPVVQEPVMVEPVVDEPAIVDPLINEPTLEEPVINEPVIEPPAVEEPLTESPAIEPPVVEPLAAEQPVVKEPATDQPTVDEPVMVPPVSDEPTESEPAPITIGVVRPLPILDMPVWWDADFELPFIFVVEPTDGIFFRDIDLNGDAYRSVVMVLNSEVAGITRADASSWSSGMQVTAHAMVSAASHVNPLPLPSLTSPVGSGLATLRETVSTSASRLLTESGTRGSQRLLRQLAAGERAADLLGAGGGDVVGDPATADLAPVDILAGLRPRADEASGS